MNATNSHASNHEKASKQELPPIEFTQDGAKSMHYENLDLLDYNKLMRSNGATPSSAEDSSPLRTKLESEIFQSKTHIIDLENETHISIPHITSGPSGDALYLIGGRNIADDNQSLIESLRAEPLDQGLRITLETNRTQQAAKDQDEDHETTSVRIDLKHLSPVEEGLDAKDSLASLIADGNLKLFRSPESVSPKATVE